MEEKSVRREKIRRWMVMLIACLPCFTGGVSAAAASGSHRAPSRQSQDAVWLEAIEIYTLPWDPQWKAAAEAGQFPHSFRKSAREIDGLAAGLERRSKGNRLSDSDEASLNTRKRKLVDDLRAAADRLMPLTVVRAWDGLQRKEVVLVFGRGQRAIADRLAGMRPLLAVLDTSKPGDDFQAFRTTVSEIRPSSRVPSELVRVEDAPDSVQADSFGQIDASPLATPMKVATTKDPTPGSGVLTLEIASPPIELQIDTSYPWFAEFRLFELNKDGTRGKEVRFEGANSVVAARNTRRETHLSAWTVALGRVEVKSPQPWGYEAEIVKWYGVAPKDRLVPDAKGAKAKNVGGSSRGAPPTPSGAPVEETDPPEIPDEPTTPSVPESRS